MKYSTDQKTTLKNTSIVSYLHNLGIDPVQSSGSQLLYCSPLTGERTPSFYVKPEKNVFNCFSSGEKGDVIRLVMLIEKVDFVQALNRLASVSDNKNTSFSFSGQPVPTTIHQASQTPQQTLLEEKDLTDSKLKAYISSRGIPYAVAKLYVKEVRYRNGNRFYNAVGFRTDKGGYAIRFKGFKSCLGHTGITTIEVPGSTTINLFEGFFDFLSALTYYKQSRPSCTTIILNSNSNLNQALPKLQGANMINCYFDNDTGGRSTYVKLGKLRLPVKDRSAIYHGYNDFNDMLCQCPI